MYLIIDIDNVICNFVEAMINYTNKRLGTKYESQDVIVWDFVDSPRIDIEYEQMMGLFKDFFDSKLWHTAPLYPDSKEVLDWIKENHQYIFLTNRPPEAVENTICYFQQNKLPFIDTHVLKSYGDRVESGTIVFINGHNKAKYAKEIGADLAIEDKPQTIQEYLNIGVRVVLKIEPYNSSIWYSNPNRLLEKCLNLTEFKFLIQQLEGYKNERKIYSV